MTQPTPQPHPPAAPQGRATVAPAAEPADEQPTMRLEPADPDATRPMSLADLLDGD